MNKCETQRRSRWLIITAIIVVLLLLVGCDTEGGESDANINDMTIRETDYMEMVHIPGGEFWFVRWEGKYQVILDDYYIDQHEVTNTQYELCVADGACSAPFLNKSATRDFYYGNAEYDNFPVVYVSWDQANDYCRWAGGALPTEAQWENAARGVNDFKYVWGDDTPTCDLTNHGICVGDTTEVGSYPDGNSPDGLNDMAGNVAEWTSDWSDWFAEGWYETHPLDNPVGTESGETRVVRGGAWGQDETDLEIHTRNGGYPNLMNAQTGFRCVVNEDQSVVVASKPVTFIEAETPKQPVVEPNERLVDVVVSPHYVSPYDSGDFFLDYFLEYIEEFSLEQDEFDLDMITVADDEDYNIQLEAMITDGQMPCLFQVDQNNLYNFVDKGWLLPLEGLISPEIIDDMLPSVVDFGTYQGNLYALSQDEMGFALWGNRELLEAAGVRIPTSADDAWTLEEFEAAMASIKAYDRAIYPLDMSDFFEMEDYSMSIYPILRGFGGDILDADTMKSGGVLDSAASIEAMTTLQRWWKSEYIDDYSIWRDPLKNQKNAMVLTTQRGWKRYYEDMGENLVLIPMPDFGAGQATSVGGWTWVISQSCANPGGAAAFLEYLLGPDVMERHNKWSGMIPSRRSLIEQPDSLYREGGPLEIFVQQLEVGAGAVLPKVPEHQAVVEEFERAVELIIQGDDVESVLIDTAVNIDRLLEENQ